MARTAVSLSDIMQISNGVTMKKLVPWYYELFVWRQAFA